MHHLIQVGEQTPNVPHGLKFNIGSSVTVTVTVSQSVWTCTKHIS